MKTLNDSLVHHILTAQKVSFYSLSLRSLNKDQRNILVPGVTYP